uniref:Si:ch211-244c8.4 n=1 Tax=Poecilia formosa TaxID=48698 RepID=A0A096MBL5_POEFO
MDVQTENTDPPPNESQPSGKIRKGFKLFGKRKPGSIFSIRNKGDGNNKSPVIRSKTSEGLYETPAQDSEQEQEEEALGEDGVLATAPARTSISSASSAKSLGFLSLLRGGKRGAGDRRVHTVSQPVARQRRGLKGLFSNVKLRSKDKEDKEEAPPSPLLQSSRTNSVEIIKEDMTLTPKCQPRALDSPETERTGPVQSSATTPTKTSAAQVTSAENVSTTYEHVSPLLTPEPPLVPGDNSLSSLLADISSLLTFDSISGGGDIMADVEAEWGKVSSAISADIPPSSTSPFFKSTLSSSPTTSSTVSSAATVKASSVAVSSSSLSSHSVELSSDCAPASTQAVTSIPGSKELSAPTHVETSQPKASTDSLDGEGGQRNQGVPSKTKEQHHELPPKEKKTPQSKAMGLSKIPVVGGGKVSRQPVRENQHDEPSKDLTSPVLEEKHYFNSHNAGGKDKISSPEAIGLISKQLQEEHQQPQQAKVPTSSARDSKIPLKHGSGSHTASQVSQTKEPPRTKIPVSKVPVRRAGNKPATAGSSTQIRK